MSGYRWFLRFPDRTLEMCTTPVVTAAQVKVRYPDAVEIVPLPDGAAESAKQLHALRGE